jgi:hypothetical protein
VNKNGKYLYPAFPTLSFITFTIFSYNISINDCHLPGTIVLTLLLINPLIINNAITKYNDELVKERSKLPKGWIGINLIISNCSNMLVIIFSFMLKMLFLDSF